MKDLYDIIVAGAGPAGASCARILSKSGFKVLLIERSQEIGAPNFSSAGMPDYVISEFDLPKSTIATYWDKFEIITKNESSLWHYPKTRGYVLKFNELKKFLVQDAVQNGCEVLIGTNVTGSKQKNSFVDVEFSGIHRGKAKAKLVVDATGPCGTLATQANLRKSTPCSPSSGLEYIMSNVKFKNKNNLAFYLGAEFAPFGYGWIFPMGSNTAKVGVAVYETTKHKSLPLLELLNKFVQKVDILKNAQPVELHGGTLFVNGGITKLVQGKLLVIGDAAVNVNPLGAEGIRHHLYASKFASSAIKNALHKNNMIYLKNYEKDWKKYARRWKASLFLTKAVYAKSNDKIFDKGLGLIKNLSADDIFDLFFEYKFQKLLKIVPKLSHKTKLKFLQGFSKLAT